MRKVEEASDTAIKTAFSQASSQISKNQPKTNIASAKYNDRSKENVGRLNLDREHFDLDPLSGRYQKAIN